MTARPHRQYTALAGIMHLLATESAQALEHLIEERSHLGWPTTTMGDGGSRATSTDTRPERGASELLDINALIAQIQDDITTIASLASSALQVTRQAKGHRVPHNPQGIDPPVFCSANQMHGRQGAIEWGDPTCLNLPDKAGLCHACYLREWRWRKANNLGPRDIQPLDHAV